MHYLHKTTFFHHTCSLFVNTSTTTSNRKVATNQDMN